MPIIAKRNSGDFIPAPAGAHRAVCVDVVDLGIISKSWEGKERKVHEVRVVWQIDELMENGTLFIASQRYTLSLDPKANLRKMIEGWVGTVFTTELEAEGFDVETLIGQSGIVTITHRAGSKGGVFANVTAVSPLMKGMVPMHAVGYTRVVERPAGTPVQDDEAPPHSDDDLNF